MQALIQTFSIAKTIMQIKNFTFTFLLFLLGGLLSCGSLPQSSMNAINLRSGVATTNIRDIKPQDFKATVYLQGKVAQLVPCLSSINCKTQLAQSGF